MSLTDGAGTPLGSDQAHELAARYPVVPADLEAGHWRWTDPHGIRRSAPGTLALPRLHHEAPVHGIPGRHLMPPRTGSRMVLLVDAATQ